MAPDHTLSTSLQETAGLIQEYFDRKSRAPSPALNKANAMWYSAPPILEDHDNDVVNVFLHVFNKHIPETFPVFVEACVGHDQRAEYCLAMAATGGLFCSVPGSFEVAKSMYNDARRLLLAYVCISNSQEQCQISDKLRFRHLLTRVIVASRIIYP